MTTSRIVRRAAAAALVAGGFAAPSAGLDVLVGLGPSDFRVDGLGLAESRALDGAVPLDPADWIPAANSEAEASRGTTLTELGVPIVAAEVVRADDSRGTSLDQVSASDVRLFATPDLREALGNALGAGGNDLGSLGEVLEELGGDGGLDDVLDDVLDGGVLDDVPLDQLPVDELLDAILDLDGGLLDGATGGLLGGLGRP